MFSYGPKFDAIICKSETPPAITSSSFASEPNFVIVPQSAISAYKSAAVWSQYNILSEKRVVVENLTEGALATTIITKGYGPLSSITHLTVSGVLNEVDFQSIKDNMKSLMEVDISNAVLTGNSLPDYAFSNNKILTKIVLPNTLEVIGEYAFNSCKNLTDIHIPSSVKTIRNRAFEYCSQLSGELILPEGLERIESYAFRGCNKLSGPLRIPSSVNHIGSSAFYGCSNLSGELILPEGLERIESYAFCGCNKLSGPLRIPSSVNHIGSSAFYGCSNLSGDLTIPVGIEAIEDYTFYYCSNLKGTLSIPSTVEYIGGSAFNNSGISGILSLPDSLNYLGHSAFYQCSGLTGTVIIPEKIENIANACFAECEQIETLVLHKNFLSFQDAAFQNCKSLNKIVLQSSTPPTGPSNTFEGILYDCHLSLPKNSAMNYLTSTLFGSFQKVSEIQREYEVMKGESVSLYGTTPIYPVENIRYVWEPGAGLSDSTVAYPVFKADTSRQYKLTVYSNDAVYDVDSVFVQVYPLEIFDANDKELLCGQSIQLDSIQTNYQGEGPLRYQWTPATGLNCDTIPNPVCSSLESISYTLTVTTPNDHSASDTVNVNVYNLPPNPVQGLRAENIDFDQIQLNWQKNHEADIAGYQVIRRSSVQAQDLEIVAMLDVDSIIDSLQIEEAREYSYLVYAIDYEGLKSDSAQISILSGDATAPDTVRNLSAQGLPDQIVLSWDPNTEHDLWKYRIYRHNEMDSLVLIAEVPLDTCSYADNTVINEIVYRYAVTAVDNTNNSTWNPAYESPLSEPVQAYALDIVPPAVPVLLEAQASNKRVELKWQAQSEPDLSLFRIYRSMDSFNFSLLDSVSGDTSLYTDTLVENFKSYCYCLSAVDTNRNESLASAVIKAEPFNLPPVITAFSDVVIHNQTEFMVPVYYDLSSSQDPDGQIVDYAWYINDMNVRSTPVLNTEIPQGTNRLKAVVTDNDGEKDSVEFKVSIDGGYYTYESIEGQNAGITAIGMDLLFVPQAGGKMQVLNADLEPSFDVTISGEIQSVSSVSQDTVMYLSSSSKTIYCFDKRGISKWSLPLGGDLKATPTIDVYRNRIYVGVSNNNLFAIDRTSGQADWSYRTTSPISQPGVIIGRDHLLIITDNGTAHIFDLTKTPTDQILSPVGTLNLNTTICTAPAIDKDGFLYVSTTDGRLIKFYFDMNNYTGDILWNLPVGSSFETSPVIANNGNIYMGDTQGILYVMDNLSGQLMWQKDLGSAITSTITINEYGYYYVGTESGEMYAFIDRGQGFGEIIWHYASSSAISNATAFVNSCLLFSNRNGELFKIRENWIPTSTRAFPTEPQWGTYQGNYRRSGVQAETSGYTALPAVKTKPVVKQSPSPFSTDFQLEITLSATAPINIQLMDIFGQIVHFEDLGILNPGTHQRTIQASNWPAGVYLYQVRIGDGVYSEKIMKR